MQLNRASSFQSIEIYPPYICLMKFDTVIFDMDGLLIDSEPLWQEAADEVLGTYGINLTEEQYISTTGLRTREFLSWWFSYFKVRVQSPEDAEDCITRKVIEKVRARGQAMQGVEYIFQFFAERKFKIGIATSSPFSLIDIVIDKLNIRDQVHAISSAQDLVLGKPHPQVYLDCATLLESAPKRCICFEDSFNGMIAAKAARMKCVVVPAPLQHHETRWDAADLKLGALSDFNDQIILGI